MHIPINLVILVVQVTAWAKAGHQIVGSIAQNYLHQKAKDQLDIILSESNGQLERVASWADFAKFQPQYSYSRKLHYVATQDNPPIQCGFDEERDCSDGQCILGAIAKFTKQAQCGPKTAEQVDAVKFLVHFFGDISQPLHNSKREAAGNAARAIYRGRRKNLHMIWDSDLVNSRVDAIGNQSEYVDYIISHIDNEKFDPSFWISKYSIFDESEFGNSRIAIDYSIDSNQYLCKGVWDKFDLKHTEDLAGDYYNSSAFIVDLQLAKAAYRLADLFNRLYVECTNKE